MNKKVLTKIAMDEVNELLNRITLKPKEAQEIYFKGAYIRLFDTDIFKEENSKREIQVKYYRILGEKIFYFKTFIYYFSCPNQIKLENYFYDNPSVSHQIIRPSMDLENLLKDFKEFEG
jgi:hypothetical protein